VIVAALKYNTVKQRRSNFL